MPSHAASNPDIMQLYIDDHFCFAYKLGIVRHLDLYNKDFFQKHPEIILEKKSNSPDEDKSVHDVRLLVPALQDLFAAHPLFQPDTFYETPLLTPQNSIKNFFSGDTFGTDADGNGRHFQKSYIPLNSRAGLENKDYSINQDGIPCYPNDPSLTLKPEGTSTRLNG